MHTPPLRGRTRPRLPFLLRVGTPCLLVWGGCAADGAKQAGPAFPDTLAQERTLDIHVLRDGRTIRMTNTTGEPLPPGRMWLNKWFSREIPDGLAVGESASFDLGEFRDEFGEVFQGGGFFAGFDPDDLVLAQYETELAGERRLLGFIVIDGRPR